MLFTKDKIEGLHNIFKDNYSEKAYVSFPLFCICIDCLNSTLEATTFYMIKKGRKKF